MLNKTTIIFEIYNTDLYVIPGRHSSQWKPAVLFTHFKHSPVSWLQLRTAFKSMLLLQSQGRQAIPSSGFPKYPSEHVSHLGPENERIDLVHPRKRNREIF